ncbi:MAG: fructose-6-phosphate aldolase [Holosporaceae bacterium]|jgi:transaldolase|nr:fructose-6-phosphate aldolase [Holosporaceae bacterium]
MEIFLDTADIDDIELYKDFIDGVTTNPSLAAKSGAKDFEGLIKKICKTVSGPVSAEVVSETYDGMLAEGKRLAKIHSAVCVKLPCTFDGLRVCKALSADGISTNLTLCFSPTQGLLAAKCGATYVSPFIGRLDDIGHDGMALIEELVDVFDVHGYETKVLAASVRNLQHVIQSAMIGAGAITMPPKILAQCFDHPLTTKGLEIFAKDWKGRK